MNRAFLAQGFNAVLDDINHRLLELRGIPFDPQTVFHLQNHFASVQMA